MASSGIRKDVWAQRGFSERLQYSEDDEYTRWCRANGYQVRYVPESVAMHSHNYTLAQAWKRSYGEGKALAAVWNGTTKVWNWPRMVLLGWGNDARRDLTYCCRNGRLHEWPRALRVRWVPTSRAIGGLSRWLERVSHRQSLRLRPAATLDFLGCMISLEQSPITTKVSSPDESTRFTLDGSKELEARLAKICFGN
jgi:rhamnosyltransferase